MNKKHLVYAAIGLAVLIGLYFAFGSCNCQGSDWKARLVKPTPPSPIDVQTDKSEV